VTIHGWDASHYDAPPTARDGIDFYTHKAAEGHKFYRDAEYGPALNAARNLGIPVLGSYFVNHSGSVADQADWWVSIVNADTPWWRTVPWIWQIDAEKFPYMDRAPTLAEINALGDAICARTGSPASSVVAYAPKWLYGDNLKGLKYRLWASNYGSNPAVPYRQAYPGDSSPRWVAYSGQTPIILQYGSKTTIAGQTTCDANAYRGTLAELVSLIKPTATEGATMADLAPHEIVNAIANGSIDKGYITGTEARDTPGYGLHVTEHNLRTLGDQLAAVAADVAELKARPAVGLTDAQVDAIADKLVAAADNPLGDADKPAIKAALRELLREGVA